SPRLQSQPQKHPRFLQTRPRQFHLPRPRQLLHRANPRVQFHSRIPDYTHLFRIHIWVILFVVGYGFSLLPKSKLLPSPSAFPAPSAHRSPYSRGQKKFAHSPFNLFTFCISASGRPASARSPYRGPACGNAAPPPSPAAPPPAPSATAR